MRGRNEIRRDNDRAIQYLRSSKCLTCGRPEGDGCHEYACRRANGETGPFHYSGGGMYGAWKYFEVPAGWRTEEETQDLIAENRIAR